MSARLLKSTLSYRCYSAFVRSTALRNKNPPQRNDLATISPGIPTASISFNRIELYKRNFRLYTTRTAPKENNQNAGALLSVITSYYKETGYVLNTQCQKLIETLEDEFDECNELLSKENIQFLLYACGNQMPGKRAGERMELFERFWQLLKEHKLLTIENYMQKLQILQHNHVPLDDLQTFLKEIATVAADVVEKPELFNELLSAACSCGRMQDAMEVLAEMRQRNFALTEQNFNALIMGHGRNHDLNSIQTTLDSMQAAGVALSNDTQATLFIAFLENNANSKAMEILQRYEGGFDAQQILKMLRTGIKVDLDTEMTVLLIRELPGDYTSGPDIGFELRQLCNEFIHNGKFNVVRNIISALPQPSFGEKQSIDTYASGILTELFRAQVEEAQIIDFAKALKENDKNTRALHIATEIAMHRNPPSALIYLKALSEVEPLRPHYFWPLIMYNFRRHGENGILTTLDHLKRMNVSCDNETLTLYILPYMKITLENPIQGVKMLLDAGVKTSSLLAPVLRHLLSQGKLIEPLQILELYPSKLNITEDLLPILQQLSINVRATRRYHQFAKVLNELSKRNEDSKIDFVGHLLVNMLRKQQRLQQDLKTFQRFLNEIEKIGLRISASAVNSLDEILSNLKNTDGEKANDELLKRISQKLQQMKDRNLVFAQNVPNSSSTAGSSIKKHPREMTLNELECHLIELESKSMNTRGVLRRLLQLYVRENSLDRALEIKAKCDKLRVQESPGMLASVFDLYIKVGELSKAEETLKRLQKTYPGFQLDEHKFIDYAALLVRENQLEMGLKLLAERSANQRINGGDYVIKNVWNFLTNIAQLAARQEPKLPKDQNLARDAFEFLSTHGYCNAHNSVLGPIVREYLLRGDIKSAISEFSRLGEKYKHTPLQYELLSLLVKLSNGLPEETERFPITTEEAQELLSNVTTVVSKVHGTTNMNSALVLAFAESGTDSQLRRLLMNPEFRVNHELLQKNCEHLGKEGSIRTLLRLAKGSRGLNRAINEQVIYDLLLQNFVKNNDCAAALDLFERIEADDDLKISNDFVKNLTNLLKANNVEIPSNVALKVYVNRVKV